MPGNTDISLGQALIYSVTEGDKIFYRFKLYNGEEGKISLPVIESLSLNILALPAIVTTDNLALAMYKDDIVHSEVLLELIQKADTNFVKKLIQTRVSIDRFRDFVAKAATTDVVTQELLKKADLEYVNSALHGKVDRGQVYTIDKVHEVMMQFIGSRAVYNIASRDSLEYGMNPFVWVIDASDDTSPFVQSPALYKWNKNHWVYLGTVGNFGSGNVDFSNYYTKAEIDSFLTNVLPVITGDDDIGKVVTVSYEYENGQPVYKYVLSEVQSGTVDTSALEQLIRDESIAREQGDTALSINIDQRCNAIVTDTQRAITTLQTSIQGAESRLNTHDERITALEANQGNVDFSSIIALIGEEATFREQADEGLGQSIVAVSEHLTTSFNDMVARVGEYHNAIRVELDGTQTTVNDHENRISLLEDQSGGGDQDLSPIYARLDAIESTLGSVNTKVTTILVDEFDQEV